MSEPPLGATEHLDGVDNVLRDAGTATRTRRSILETAAVGVASAAAAGLVDPTRQAWAGSSSGGIRKFGRTANTIEKLAITYFTDVLRRAENGESTPPPEFSTADAIDQFRAVNRSEKLHLKLLEKNGYESAFERFWIPDDAFGPQALADDDGVDFTTAFEVSEIAEEITSNLYLIGITETAREKEQKLARHLAEILAIEYSHRSAARAFLGKDPFSNHGYATYEHEKESKIYREFEKFGIGFDEEGAQPGRFYDFEGTNGRERPIENEKPDPEGSLP